jgi:hypothetical protein
MNIKYCDYESFDAYNDSVTYVLDIYRDKLNNFYNDKQCIMYRSTFCLTKHKGILHLQQMTQNRLINIMNCKRTTSPNIDDILATYMICFLKITKDESLLGIVVTFCILFREYLNTVGWDHKRRFHQFDVDIGYNYKGSFCSLNDSEYIPDLINDFVAVFMNMDPLFKIDEKILVLICDNFCNWLFVNHFTGLKLYPNNTDV